MNPNDLDDIDIKEELEFNDGVGNALSQKKPYKFSWKKTLIVSSIGLVIVIFFTMGILEIGKILLNMNETEYVEQETIPTIESVLSDSSSDTWDALPEDTLQVNESNENEIAKDDIGRNNKSLNRDVKMSNQLFETQTEPTEKNIQNSLQQTRQLSDPEPIKVVTSKAVPIEKKVTPPKQKLLKEPTVYRVIAGSFSTYSNANRELKRIKGNGFNGYVWSLTNKKGVVTYKVQLAAFSSKSKAQSFVKTLKKQNITSFISTN